MRWLFDSNRLLHFAGIAIVTLLTFALLYEMYGMTEWQHYVIAAYVALGVSGAMEFKDVHHDNGSAAIWEWEWEAWDWLDVLAGMLGYLLVAVLLVVIKLTLP